MLKHLQFHLTKILLTALLFGTGVSAWAQTDIFNQAGGGSLPSGWTNTTVSNGNAFNQGAYWLLDALATVETLTTSSYDLSSYSTAQFSADYAAFGTGNQNKLKVEISYNGGTSYTQVAVSPNFTTGSSPYITYTVTLTQVSNAVRIRLSPNSTSSRGLRLQKLILQASGSSGPTATTGAASDITSTGATLNGSVTNGSATATSFQYGLTTGYGSTITATPSPVTGNQNISAAVTGLSINTQYNFRAVAGSATGSNATFWTLAAVPNAPIVNNPTLSTIDVAISGGANPSNTTYAIAVGSQYVQANGTLGASPVYQTAATWGTKTVTGLTESTEYTFTTIARNGANVNTAASAGATISTLANTDPTIGASTLDSYGSLCIGNSATQFFFIVGENLDAEDVVVTAFSGYTVSLDPDSGFTTSLNLTPVDGEVLADVYVRFSPTQAITYNGSIQITGGGTVSPTLVAVSGTGINTPATVTTSAASSVSVFSATLGGNVTNTGCSTVTTTGVVIGTGTTPAIGGNGVLNFAASPAGSYPFTVSATGLQPSTQYYVRAYAINSGGTSYGSAVSFTTSAYTLDAPVAEEETVVSSSSFRANWNVVPGATGYRLDVSTEPDFTTFAPATNLIISQYGEGGSGNRKYVEIYNGTGADVDLSQYVLRFYANGSTNVTFTYSYSGTLANGGTFTVAHNLSQVPGANFYTTSLNFNGNDAVTLAWNGGSGSTYTDIDIVGIVGTDPIIGFNVAGTTSATANHYLIRKPNVTSPTTDWSVSGGTNIDNSQWIVTPYDDEAPVDLGSHTFTGGSASSFVTGYENLPVGNVDEYLVENLQSGVTYYYRVRAENTDYNVTSANSNTIEAETGLINVWNGTAWTAGVVPTSVDDAIIEGLYDTGVEGTFSASVLTVNEGGSMVIASGDNIVVTNEVINNAEPEDFIVENNANLIQINDNAVNTGEIHVLKSSSPLYRLDYTIWSAPIVGQSLLSFSPGTVPTRFYSYSEALDIYTGTNPSLTFFTPGYGYLIRTPNNWVAYAEGVAGQQWTGTFEGTPNNGEVTVPMQNEANGFNMVGNPYPSPINISAFLTENTGVIEDGSALYFFRKRNDTSAGSPTYATITLAGYTANTAAGGDTSDGVFSNPDNSAQWVINPGQGFFVKAEGGNLTFNNAMRRPVNNGQFFRTAQDETQQASRYWINMAGTNSEFSQMAVIYKEGKTLGIDYGWDGTALIGDGAVNLYSTAEEKALAIQARPAFQSDDVVNVGFRASQPGTYTISLDHADGLFTTGQNIYLIDTVADVSTNLQESDYSFTTEGGQFDERFRIVYDQASLGNDTPVFNADAVVVYQNNGDITIEAGKTTIETVTVYDINGRVIYTGNNVNATATVIKNLHAAQQVLIVNVATEKGTVSKKIVF